MTIITSLIAVLAAYRQVIHRLFTSKTLWQEIFAPLVWGLLSWLVLLICGLYFRVAILSALWNKVNWFGNIISYLAILLIVTLASAGVTILRVHLALDRLVITTAASLGVTQSNEGLIAMGHRLITESASRAAISTLLFGLSLVTLAIPGINILAIGASCSYLGYDILASCLSTLAIPSTQQRKFLLANKVLVLAMGLVAGTLLALPLAGVVMLPISYAAGAELVIRRASKELS